MKRYQAMKTPDGVQRHLDEEIQYDLEPDGPRCRSPRLTLEAGVAHCMGGALLAAAALRVLGHEPLILDLESVRDDDHVLALFRSKEGLWGAAAKSNYAGLRYREPVYRTLRELVMSYFEHYYNLSGERTLRAYSTRPVNLKRFDAVDWMTTDEPLWAIPNCLAEVAHTRLLPPEAERRLTRLDERSVAAGKTGMR
ncbi:MAG: hypothetical protein C0504_01180 [Candidatus Solibacter sp.]|nr:hypothetical protein [Candidatus Solibacter sp.]